MGVVTHTASTAVSWQASTMSAVWHRNAAIVKRRLTAASGWRWKAWAWSPQLNVLIGPSTRATNRHTRTPFPGGTERPCILLLLGLRICYQLSGDAHSISSILSVPSLQAHLLLSLLGPIVPCAYCQCTTQTVSVVVFFKKRFYLFILREREEREEGRETLVCERYIDQLPLAHPLLGTWPQPRHVPWLGIKPATL